MINLLVAYFDKETIATEVEEKNAQETYGSHSCSTGISDETLHRANLFHNISMQDLKAKKACPAQEKVERATHVPAHLHKFSLDSPRHVTYGSRGRDPLPYSSEVYPDTAVGGCSGKLTNHGAASEWKRQNAT